MAFDNLLIERDGAVAIVTINRPAVLNALDIQTIDQLDSTITALRDESAGAPA